MKSLFITSATLFLLFFVLHITGQREHTAIISGMLPATPEAGAMGLFYALSWFGAVLLAPVLLIAGLLLKVRLRFASAK